MQCIYGNTQSTSVMWKRTLRKRFRNILGVYSIEKRKYNIQ
jgi:hypothetical protein